MAKTELGKRLTGIIKAGDKLVSDMRKDAKEFLDAWRGIKDALDALKREETDADDDKKEEG